MNDTETINIYHDARRKEFYARVRSEKTNGIKLPDFDYFTEDDAAVLIKEHPELEAYFSASNLSAANEKEISDCIKQHNDRIGTTVTVRWLMCDFRKINSFRQINDGGLCAELENRRGSFTDIGYDGGYDYDAMTAFAREYASSVMYGVVDCEKCGRFRVVKFTGKRGACACGQTYNISQAEYRSKMYAQAVGKAAELNRPRNNTSDRDDSGITPKPFYYKGDVYMFNVGDCELLHKLLYKDYAFDEVFTGGERVSGFTQKYESYIYGLSINSVMPELYRSRNRTIAEMREKQLCAADALYRYFNKFGMGGALHRMRNGNVYSFDSAENYVAALVDSSGDRRKDLISLYDAHSCEFFFSGYENKAIELSRLIYDVKGRFVFISGDTYTDFGNNFMTELCCDDGKAGARGLFLTAIKSNEKFWQAVKDEYTDDCEFIAQCNDNYGWLCLMRFAVTGRRILVYGRLEIQNGAQGEKTIRAIVENAYKTRSAAALADYADLCKAFELGLIDRLEALGRVAFDNGESVVSGLKDRVLPVSQIPSVQAYLYCARATVSDKAAVKIMYDGRCDDIISHARKAVESPKGGAAPRALIADRDVNAALEFIFDDLYERKATLKARFDKLVKEVEKLQSR